MALVLLVKNAGGVHVALSHLESVKTAAELRGVDKGLELSDFGRCWAGEEPVSAAVSEVTALIHGGVDLES